MFELSKSVRKKGGIEDDLKILRTWVEYSEDRKIAQNLMYEFEMEDESGNVKHLFKCIKLVRIVRLPKSAKQSRVMMRTHARMLQGLWQQNIKFITVIANILNPVPFGLMYLYGVQGVAETEDDAKEIAGYDFTAFIHLLQGTYRVLEFQSLTYDELEWLREKMFSMKNLTVVRGLPKAKESGRKDKAQDHGKGMGMKVDPDEDSTTEEFIAGMSDKEYVVQILSTPVKAEHLERWLTQTAEEMTRFNSELQGTSNLGFNLSIPMMYMANLGASEGWSHSYNESSVESVTLSDSLQNSFSTSIGENIGQGYGETVGHSLGSSFTEGTGENYSTSIGQSEGTSWGEGIGANQGISQNFSENVSVGDSYTESMDSSTSHSDSINASMSDGTSTSTSVSHSTSTNVSDSVGTNTSTSLGRSQSQSMGWSTNSGGSTANSVTRTVTDSFGTSNTYSRGTSDDVGENWSTSRSTGDSYSYGYNSSSTVGGSTGGSKSESNSSGFAFIGNFTGSETETTSWSADFSSSFGENESWGRTQNTDSSIGGSKSHSDSETFSSGTTNTHSVGTSAGVTNTESWSSGRSGSINQGESINMSTGTNKTHSVSQGSSEGYSQGYGTSRSVTQGYGSDDSTSNGQSQSWGQTSNKSQGTSVGQNQSANTGANIGGSSNVNQGQSWGMNKSTSYGQSTSDNFSQSASSNTGRTYSQNNGKGSSQGWSKGSSSSRGDAIGSTGAKTSATSSNIGVGPSIGFSITYKWIDQEVKNILTLLEFQNMRLMKSLSGNAGAFFTDVYIATPDRQTQEAASILAKSAWSDENAMVCPLQVLNLRDEEQKHLLYHFSAFSADNTKVNNNRQMQSYKYSTILLPLEYTAYTHLPRISDGGVYADVGDVPKFAVPSMKKGDIYMGKILSGERWTMGDKYETIFEYRLDEKELMHGIFTGESRSGKTVAATRFVAELTKVRRSKTGKRLRIVALDPKQDWRVLGKFVEPERFHFYSLGNPEFLPINLNICKVPHNVNPQVWIDGIIEIFCRSYGLLERGKAILAETFYALYEDAGVFEDSPNWRDFVPERSSKVTMTKVYHRMQKIKLALEGNESVARRGRMGNEAMDCYTALLDRLQVFGRKFSIEARLFAREDGMGIDELIGKDDVIVLESYGLETTFKNFIFGCVTSGFFKYAQGHEGGFLADDQYETVLIIEEANEVLTGSDTAGKNSGGMISLGGQSEFEKILDQSAGLGLFIIAITQKIADMPSSCVANSGLIFAGKISRQDDVTLVIRKIAREERYEDRDILKWFPRSPIGWFVCRSSRNFDFKETEPSLVHIDPLGVNPPTNVELEGIMVEKKAMALLNS